MLQDYQVPQETTANQENEEMQDKMEDLAIKDLQDHQVYQE